MVEKTWEARPSNLFAFAHPNADITLTAAAAVTDDNDDAPNDILDEDEDFHGCKIRTNNVVRS